MSKIEHIRTGNVEIFLFSGLDKNTENDRQSLQPTIQSEIQEAHAPSRKAELLALDTIWESHFKGIKFQRKETGKPICSDYELSISHHGTYLAVARSAEPVGVDIESPRKQLYRIRKKFLHENEYTHEDDLKALQLIWSVKEVVYKIYDDDQLFFWRDIELLNLNPNGEQLKAAVTHRNKTVELEFGVKELAEGIKMVYSL